MSFLQHFKNKEKIEKIDNLASSGDKLEKAIISLNNDLVKLYNVYMSLEETPNNIDNLPKLLKNVLRDITILSTYMNITEADVRRYVQKLLDIEDLSNMAYFQPDSTDDMLLRFARYVLNKKGYGDMRAKALLDKHGQTIYVGGLPQELWGKLFLLIFTQINQTQRNIRRDISLYQISIVESIIVVFEIISFLNTNTNTVINGKVT